MRIRDPLKICYFCFTHFDPFEDTESKRTDVQTRAAALEFHPLRSVRGY